MAISLGPSGLDINGTIVDGPEDLGAPTTFNSVGSYGWFLTSGAAATHAIVGATTSGSNLRYSTSSQGSTWPDFTEAGVVTGSNSDLRTQSRFFSVLTSPSGTWRNMGPGNAGGGNGTYSVCVWVRTA